MHAALAKTKLTLWVENEAKRFGKQWAKKHNESVSQIFSDYLLRLRQIEERPLEPTPIVNRITGVIRDKEVSLKDYKKHLEGKYLRA